ncbi:hypothetical protein [Nocardia sp. NPDC051750]|uniref:hypothetical protein n=1 Tax=Nocardia sp. NPDC051750 TaxID=3364325 RepID=UPI0037987029
MIWALREEAQRQGVGIMTDRSLMTALSRWENNRNTPDQFYRRLLGVVLGLPIAEDFAVRTSTYEQDVDRAIEALDVLTRWDHEERPVFTSAVGLVETDRVISGYLFARSHAVDDSTPAPTSVAGQQDSVAGRIRVAVSALMSVDFDQGGGRVRTALMHYFQNSVIPELRAERVGDRRRAVYGAGAEVAQLLGWSAYDAGHQPVAARYFTLGLRLADEASDQLMGARLLANLSHQYNSIGNYPQALTMARAAQAALRGRGTASVETLCVMMEARALANLRDERAASQAIGHAERLFDRRSDDEPDWIGYYDAAELSGDIAHAFRDLGVATRSREYTQRALTPTTPRRTRAFIQLVDAGSALKCGDIEEAASLATGALGSGGGLQSQRYLRYLQGFCRSVPDLRHPAMAEFTDIVSARYPKLLRPGEARRA